MNDSTHITAAHYVSDNVRVDLGALVRLNRPKQVQYGSVTRIPEQDPHYPLKTMAVAIMPSAWLPDRVNAKIEKWAGQVTVTYTRNLKGRMQETKYTFDQAKESIVGVIVDPEQELSSLQKALEGKNYAGTDKAALRELNKIKTAIAHIQWHMGNYGNGKLKN